MLVAPAVADGTGFVVAPSELNAEIEGEADTQIRFWGHSFVYGCQGETLAQGGETGELLIADIDMHRSEQVRRIWPFLRDRRIDAFADLTRRYRD